LLLFTVLVDSSREHQVSVVGTSGLCVVGSSLLVSHILPMSPFTVLQSLLICTFPPECSAAEVYILENTSPRGGGGISADVIWRKKYENAKNKKGKM
jgi:hypothetical protein